MNLHWGTCEVRLAVVVRVMRIPLVGALMLAGCWLLACAGDVQSACRENEAAFVSCQNENIASFGGTDLIEPDYRFCDGYVGQNDEDLFDSYNCHAAAWWWADCGTSEGMAEAIATASACR